MTPETEHDELLPLLAGEVLGGLDGAEERRLQTHRSRCDRCAVDALALAELGVDLALTAPTRLPSPALESRIMAATQAAGTPPATHVSVDVPALPTGRPDTVLQPDDRGVRGPRRFLRRTAVAIAAFGLVGALVIATVIVAAERSRLDTRIAEQAGLIAVLADPTHAQAPLEAEGDSDIVAMAVYTPGTTNSFVMASGLPATPADHVYQLWSADASGVHPLGTFTFDGQGTFIAPFGVDLSSADAAMVTLEPTGGAVGQPGPQVVFGELANPATSDVLVEQDRIAVRVQEHEAAGTPAGLIGFTEEPDSRGLQRPLDLAHVGEGIERAGVAVQARVEGQRVLLEHALKEPDDRGPFLRTSQFCEASPRNVTNPSCS